MRARVNTSGNEELEQWSFREKHIFMQNSCGTEIESILMRNTDILLPLSTYPRG